MTSYRQRMTCPALTAGLVSDGAEAVPRQQALSGQPASGHFIALLARPESCIKGHCYEADFHVMRKDSSGSWSWKHPGMPAMNRDLFGALVTDPEAAPLLGSYQVCGYFRVEPQRVRGPVCRRGGSDEATAQTNLQHAWHSRVPQQQVQGTSSSSCFPAWW
jgi:hypothetical protein